MKDMKTFGQKVIDFCGNMRLPEKLPKGVSVLNPYKNKSVRDAIDTFYTKYFSDTDRRTFLIGINPGRLGAGVTGIPFTDTEALKICGIENKVDETKELSAEFIYTVIARYGGPEKFYRHFFLTSICPIGFIKEGVNFNYYDDTKFLKTTLPYIIKTFEKQMTFGSKSVAIVLGKGKNFRTVLDINRECGFFKEVLPLEHPRFIMQYRRKQIEEYSTVYRKTLAAALKN